MWTEPIDTAEQDQADTAAATTARRRQANREIRSRGLVEGTEGVQDDAPFAVYVLLRGKRFRPNDGP